MATKQAMIEAIAKQGRIDQERASKVLDIYKKLKAITFGAHDGYQITHGAFLDRDVILRALSEAA